MPSPKTAEKTEDKLIKVIAVRKFAVDFTAEELAKMKGNDGGRSQKGMTKIIDVGESASIPKKMAETLQECGAVKIKL